MGIGDFTSVMNTIVEKVCSNLRNWSDCDKIVEVSLHLFLDLSEPYYGCKLLLQLESIDFMLQNHTVNYKIVELIDQEETFKFLASPSLLNLRTTYYAALTKLVLMDNVPGRLEMFLAPFSALLQRLINEASNINSYSVGVSSEFHQQLILIKIFKDFIGDGFDTAEIENKVNNFIKDKKVIDIKPAMIYDHEIGEGFITITVMYDDIKKNNDDYKLL